MVNETDQNKKTIISMLKNSKTPVSGEIISEKLKVSRVAIWKQIKALKELGYDISSSPKGYSLDSHRDHLYSWEFDKGMEHYKAYRQLDSTMEPARKLASEGCPDFTTVVAETQNKGRGRGTRQWISDEGGLYFTWVIRPELPLAYHYIYTLGAAAALVETIRELSGIELRTKWPNDLYGGDKKVAGFLTEMETSGDTVKWLNLGIGINVNNEAGLSAGTSLREIGGTELDRKELLIRFEASFRKMLKESSPEKIRNQWMKSSRTIGKRIQLLTADKRRISGTAQSIDPSGSLVVLNRNNKTQQALFGDLYIKEEY